MPPILTIKIPCKCRFRPTLPSSYLFFPYQSKYFSMVHTCSPFAPNRPTLLSCSRWASQMGQYCKWMISGLWPSGFSLQASQKAEMSTMMFFSKSGLEVPIPQVITSWKPSWLMMRSSVMVLSGRTSTTTSPVMEGCNIVVQLMELVSNN